MIRRATSDDLPAILRLAGQLGDATDPAGLPARLGRILDHASHAVFVAEGDAGACGFAAAEHRLLLASGEWVELVALVVDEPVRRQGYGTRLVAAAEAWAARRGVERVLIRAGAAGDGAQAFYPGLGYAPLATQDVYARTLR